MPEWISRKVGPYTVGQWLLVLVAGIALAWAFRRFSGGGASSSGPAFPGEFAGQQPTGRVGAATYGADGAARPKSEAPGPGGGPQQIETNGQWLTYASGRLQAAGWSAGLVDQALRRYLEGYTLDADQYRAVEAALTVAGPPPEGAPPLSIAPVPSSPAPGTSSPEPTTAPTSPTSPTVATSGGYLDELIPVLNAMGHNYGAVVDQSDALRAARWTNTDVGAVVDPEDVPRILAGWERKGSTLTSVPAPSTGTPTPSKVEPTGPNYLDELIPVLNAMGHNYGGTVDQADAKRAARWTNTDVGNRVDPEDVPRILNGYRRKVAA